MSSLLINSRKHYRHLKLTVHIGLYQDVEIDSDIKWREGT